MTIGDAELLSSTRAGTRPPASVWAVVAAVRQITAAGKSLTTEGLGECTGLDRATLYRARAWLEEHHPTWRPDAPATTGHTNGNGHAPGVELVPTAPATVEVLELKTQTITPPTRAGSRQLVWVDALDRAKAAVNGRRTWDLFVDIYSPAADELFEKGSIGDLIALTVNYVETVIDGKVTGAERARIAKVVNLHGKAILYGMQEGLARTEGPGCSGAITYAVAVARSTHRKIRENEATA